MLKVFSISSIRLLAAPSRCDLPYSYITVRSILLTHYTTKKKRILKQKRSPKNLEWTKLMLDGMKEIEENREKNTESHPLHLVTLVKPTSGRPWWEKDIIAELNLEGKLNQPVILKNVPNINKMLQEVQHLVQIQPLKFPHGLPEHPSDFDHVTLKSNGEMTFNKRIILPKKENPNSEISVEEKKSDDIFENRLNNVDKWTLTKETVQKTLDRTIQLHEFNKDQFPTKYRYKLNQDGKMYRYNFNKTVRQFKW